MEDFIQIVGPSAVGSEHSSDWFEQQLIIAGTPGVARASRNKRTRAHLAPWQLKIARDMMMCQVGDGLALADIAGRLNMSVNHFIKAFGETEGVSPYHWYMQRRIAQAMALLRVETLLPLSKVADECGFADQSHFTKTFTRLLGIPPGRWRRNQRAAKEI